MAKKAAPKILRVGLIQNQRILEERLMRKPETVTIGHDYKKNMLVVPASNLPKTFPLFEWDGGAYLLQFTEKMEGRISRGSGVETFEELKKKGAAKRKGKIYQLRLSPTMRGRVVVGEATVLFQFVTPPPVQARPVLPASMRGGFSAGIEGPLALILLLSALIQVGFVVFLELNDWPVDERRDIAIQDRMARILIDEPDEPDPPPEEPSEPDDDGDRPEEPEPDPDPQPEPEPEQTPEERAAERHEERMEVTEAVQDRTILGTLAVEDENSALARVTDRVANLSADEAFEGTTRVEVGAGLDSDRFGRGGSPDATGEGGLAEGEELGEIGGDAQVDTGDHEETTVEVVGVMEEQAPDYSGDLDTDVLMRALRRLSNNIQMCYQNYLRQNPRAGGSVRVMITIRDRGGRGDISAAEVAVDEVGGGVGACIARELRTGRIGRIPAPEDGDARITIPYHFSPGG